MSNLDNLYSSNAPITALVPRGIYEYSIDTGFVRMNQVGSIYMVHWADPEEDRFYFNSHSTAFDFYQNKVAEISGLV